MSIPLDRLYNHLDGLCNHDILIYRFFPHGSKKLEDIQPLTPTGDWFSRMTKPIMICHDQEPLNFNLYTSKDFDHALQMYDCVPELKEIAKDMHFRILSGLPQNTFDKTLLTHSEINSTEVIKFEQQGFVPVYWWSHAVIARDWFRYAEHDHKLQFQPAQITKDFLIYNRAWSGTREYRLKFTELLVEHDLISCSNVRFNPQDNVNYKQHTWSNPKLQIARDDLESYFELNNFDSGASADYNEDDYASCGMEIILETLFDDRRQHLTEKTLRPIACGRPFMLTSTPRSLEYLKSYGFLTFSDFIDESYDTIEDPVQRLYAIATEMKRISNLPAREKTELWQNLYRIAKHNQQLFFSQQWHDSILQEFIKNLNQGLKVMWQHRNATVWKKIRSQSVVDPKNTPVPRYHSNEDLEFWLDQDVSVLQIKEAV